MSSPTDPAFNKDSLPAAVRWLFEVNGYSVKGPFHNLGAEVDLKATQLSGLGTPNVYIEVTVEHVDVSKYGRDSRSLRCSATNLERSGLSYQALDSHWP